MIFRINAKQYSGASAIEIVRELERDSTGYSGNGTLRDFVSWSLLQRDDCLPLREIAVTDKVSEETLAFSFLCLLDQYGLGELQNLPQTDDEPRFSLPSQ
jgi:hypothetical protein